MKLMINVERSQLQGVLKELGGSFSDMEIVINIKEEKSKEERSKYASLSTEDLQRIQKEAEKSEKEKQEQEYPT